MHLFCSVITITITLLICLNRSRHFRRLLRRTSFLLLKALVHIRSTWSFKIIEYILLLRSKLLVLNLAPCIINTSFVTIQAVYLILSDSSRFRKWNFRVFLDHLLLLLLLLLILILLLTLFTIFGRIRLLNLYCRYVVPINRILLELAWISNHKFKELVFLMLI